MIGFEVKGVIFDVDDTLLDNDPERTGHNLHARSRLAAVHEVGRAHGIVALQQLTPEQNRQSFLTAKVHTVEAAVWNALLMTGQVVGDEIDHDHPLLQEIVGTKNTSHLELLRQHGREVPGAVAFVRALGDAGLRDHLAIASTAVRPDVEIFLDMTGLRDLFPEDRIITKEKTTHHKPHPEAFNLAFNSLQLPDSDRSAVCAFEDDPRGIMAAKAAGLYVCAITTRFDRASLASLETAPDVIADSYVEFANHFGILAVSSA